MPFSARPNWVVALLACITLLACEGDPIWEPPTFEGGLRATCGEVGQRCCNTNPPCEWGAQCDGQGIGTCRAERQGTLCLDGSECIDGLDCLGRSCCTREGNLCQFSTECCNGLSCVNQRCTRRASDCGRRGDRCCPDRTCQSGSTCRGGFCEPCGQPGEPCCNGRCDGGATCNGNQCVNLFDCGGEGERCCPSSGNYSMTGSNFSSADAGSCRDNLICGARGICVAGAGSCEGLSCLECRARPGCGYCANGGGCLPGDPEGPEAGSCRGTWVWNALACTDPSIVPQDPRNRDIRRPGDCRAPNPRECLRQPGCGWCGDAYVGSCRPGDRGGPDFGRCYEQCWSYDRNPPETCSLGLWDPCARLSKLRCLASLRCGWCGNDSVGTCREGSIIGPSRGTCCWTYLGPVRECTMGITHGREPEPVDITQDDVPPLGPGQSQ